MHGNSAIGLLDRLERRDLPALLDYRRQAPYAALAHPTEEHLLPIFVALGVTDSSFSLRTVLPRLHARYAGDGLFRV